MPLVLPSVVAEEDTKGVSCSMFHWKHILWKVRIVCHTGRREQIIKWSKLKKQKQQQKKNKNKNTSSSLTNVTSNFKTVNLEVFIRQCFASWMALWFSFWFVQY